MAKGDTIDHRILETPIIKPGYVVSYIKGLISLSNANADHYHENGISMTDKDLSDIRRNLMSNHTRMWIKIDQSENGGE